LIRSVITSSGIGTSRSFVSIEVKMEPPPAEVSLGEDVLRRLLSQLYFNSNWSKVGTIEEIEVKMQLSCIGAQRCRCRRLPMVLTLANGHLDGAPPSFQAVVPRSVRHVFVTSSQALLAIVAHCALLSRALFGDRVGLLWRNATLTAACAENSKALATCRTPSREHECSRAFWRCLFVPAFCSTWRVIAAKATWHARSRISRRQQISPQHLLDWSSVLAWT